MSEVPMPRAGRKPPPMAEEALMEMREALNDFVKTAVGLEPEWTLDMYGNPFGWLHLPSPAELKIVAEALEGKVRLVTITPYAQERDDDKKRRSMAYHFAVDNVVLTVAIPLFNPDTMEKLAVPSVTPWFRNADWNEREFQEMFNIPVEGHPNPKRLFLDERLDAGIMTQLVPFSVLANSANTKALWEQIMTARSHWNDQAEPLPESHEVKTAEVPSFTPVAPPEDRESLVEDDRRAEEEKI